MRLHTGWYTGKADIDLLSETGTVHYNLGYVHNAIDLLVIPLAFNNMLPRQNM